MNTKQMPKAPASKKESSLSSPLLLLFLVAMLVRGAVLFVSLDSFNTDPDSYLKLAENWYSYGVFGEHKTPTAFRPPLYPAALKELVLLRVKSERPRAGQTETHPEETTAKKIVERPTTKPSGCPETRPSRCFTGYSASRQSFSSGFTPVTQVFLLF